MVDSFATPPDSGWLLPTRICGKPTAPSVRAKMTRLRFGRDNMYISFLDNDHITIGLCTVAFRQLVPPSETTHNPSSISFIDGDERKGNYRIQGPTIIDPIAVTVAASLAETTKVHRRLCEENNP